MAIGLQHYESLKTLPKPGEQRDPYRHLRSRVPAGKSGDWSVEKFDVEVDLALLRMMRDGRGTPPGTYTRLCRKSTIVMTDTDAEIEDLNEILYRARGRILVHGLGLGVVVCGLLQRDSITHIDVVEKSADVIRLVSPHIVDDRLHIHHGDCFSFKWKPSTKWDWAWHDIWDNICGDNLPEMETLARKYGRKCGRQGFWGKSYLRRNGRCTPTQPATAEVTKADLKRLRDFDSKKFRRSLVQAVNNRCFALVKRGLMESDICGGVVVYRTTDAGRAAIATREGRRGNADT